MYLFTGANQKNAGTAATDAAASATNAATDESATTDAATDDPTATTAAAAAGTDAATAAVTLQLTTSGNPRTSVQHEINKNEDEIG